MERGEGFKIFVPSYRRPKTCITHRYLKKIYYVVAEEEKERYGEIHNRVIAVPNEIQGRLVRVYNWILRNAKMDRFVIMDDDIKKIQRWENKKAIFLNEDRVMEFIEKAFLLVQEWGAHYWGINVNIDKQVYREYSPFSTVSYIGGPFMGFYKNDLLFDERMLLKEDYDMTLSQLNKHRLVLRFNAYNYDCFQSEKEGGCSTYRNLKKEAEQLLLLQKKWGDQIVKVDKNLRSHNIKKIKNSVDYNPVIRVPIRGI